MLNRYLNLCTQSVNYILAPIYATYHFCRDYTVGNLWHYVAHNGQFMSELADAATKNKGMATQSLGMLGNIAFLYVESKTQIKFILDTTEHQSKTRNPSAIIKFATNTSVFFTESDHEAIELRKNMIKFFNRKKLFDETILQTEKELTDIHFTCISEDTFRRSSEQYRHFSKSLTTIVNRVLMKTICGIDIDYENTTDMLQAINDVYANASWGWHFTDFLNLKKDVRDCRIKYEKYIHDLWAKQIEHIQWQLANLENPERENLLLFHLINLIKKNHPGLENNQENLQKFLKKISPQEMLCYLNHRYIKSLPLIIINTHPLTNAISSSLRFLARSPLWLAKLNAELADNNGYQSIDFRSHHLNHLLKEAIRFAGLIGSDNPIIRYTEREIPSLHIPGKTTLFINWGKSQQNHLSHPDSFNPDRWENQLINDSAFDRASPFSEGSRSCPAQGIIVDTIFKTVLIRVLTKSNFHLQSGSPDFSVMKKIERENNFRLSIT